MSAARLAGIVQVRGDNDDDPAALPEAVPEGWVACHMEDVAEIVGGGTPAAKDPSNFDPRGYPWITPADLSGFRGIYLERGARSLSQKGLRSSSAKRIPAGSVLMSSRAPIGYVAIAKNELSTNQGFKSFGPCQSS